MKTKVDALEYSSHIFNELKNGFLITAKANDRLNSMTISWGMLGVEWNKLIFITFIRENRFTKSLLDTNPEFTVNIPYGDFDRNIINYCGTNSGHNVDKFKDLNLTIEEPSIVTVPAIKELPLTLECKIIYKQKQNKEEISKEDLSKFYPNDVDSTFHGANKDIHIAYYGEIVDSYIVK
ncbi:flavin reductase family protein [Anaerosphaera multitolerans]|uniref:Flavin reductase family protein n=1 Tax=Anaerosphaera multitolerans TaxID=2487351 RepID=A0A437S8E6_9FIRM|nr:flavin reductase family protein [Anaerosphaera multitolerans]RVU55201.1 flavin reductase family protein [Anaerosphaera multitolerans]